MNENLSAMVNLLGGPTRLGENVDTVAGDELKMFIDNDAQLYRGQAMSIYKNLVNKHAAGRFDKKLAVKAFMHLVDSGAQKYVKEFGSRGDTWHSMFPKVTRMYVAQELADDFVPEMELGNWSNLLMKKYQKKGAKR